MKNINRYTDAAAYNADTNRPADESAVSLIKSDNRIIYGGVNIIVDGKYSSTGDTVVFDVEDNKPKVVKLGTLMPALLSSRYIIVGTVSSRDEEEVRLVANVNAGSGQWGAPWLAKMSGVSKDFTVTINTLTTGTIEYTTDQSVLATRIQDAIQSIMTTHPAGWSVTDEGDFLLVRQSSYTPNVTTFTCSDEGVSIEILTGNYQTETTGLLNNNTQIFRNDGSVTSWAGGNFWMFRQYYSVSGADETGHTLTTASVLRLSRFNMTDNPIPYDFYNGDYDAYLYAKMARYPYSKGIITDFRGRENTRILAGQTYLDQNGELQPAYPAAYLANQFGIEGATGFEQGDWFMDSCPELYLMIRNVTHGIPDSLPLDPLNQGIEDAGGTKISANTYYWTSSESPGSNGWGYNYANGRMSVLSKYFAFAVRPSAAFQI